MKLTTLSLSTAVTLLSTLSSAQLLIQTGEKNVIPSLSVDDFLALQNLKESYPIAEEQRLVEVAHPAHPSPPPPLPHEDDKNHGILDFSEYTILEILDSALHHHAKPPPKSGGWSFPWKKPPPPPKTPGELPLHRLGWLVNRSSEAQESLAKDDITLLAPSDWALTPPHRKGEHGHEHEHHDHHHGKKGDDKEQDHHAAHLAKGAEVEHPFFEIMDNQDEEDEKKRAFFSKVIGYLLKYHTLPKALSYEGIIDHSTLPTALMSGHDSEEPLRVRAEPTWILEPFPHPSVKFNFYATKRGYTIKAKNGFIHLLSAPLIPPFTPLNELFLFPQAFSSLTSSLQKAFHQDRSFVAHVDEDDVANSIMEELLNELEEEHEGVYTVFAPTNYAFNRLGPKVLALLHSPFPLSKKILKYILSYHLVPDVAFYSDYINNQTSTDDGEFSSQYLVGREYNVAYFGDQQSHREMLPAPIRGWWPRTANGDREAPRTIEDPHHKANVSHYVLPTLLSRTGQNVNATLKVSVYEYRILGKGPLRRAVVVLPHRSQRGHEHEHDHEHEHERKEKHGCHEKKERHEEGVKPVKVWKADAVVRNGAVHVINSILQPPYHYKKEDHKEDGMARAIEALFA